MIEIIKYYKIYKVNKNNSNMNLHKVLLLVLAVKVQVIN